MLERLALILVQLNNEIVEIYKRFGLTESVQRNVGILSNKFNKNY